jgi:hypothetical protein
MNWNFDPTTLERIVPVLIAVFTLGWWLKGQFSLIRRELHESLDKHELLDQTRHLENLNRFTRLEVGQARLGLMNGYHAPKDKTIDDE